ncbi:putative phage tail protein [Paenibacillus sp. TAB 01]|uniref:putative phage tail protein n=1 Tax=Paenibacillus sp. TAB 01 TaxID=3368988 RepID=UPI003752EBBA
MSEFPISSPTGQAMLERLPDLYSTIYETRVMMQDEGTELDALKTQVSAAFDQYFVATATWGLERWEAEFGIVPAAGQPDDQRRSVIRSRIRGPVP